MMELLDPYRGYSKLSVDIPMGLSFRPSVANLGYSDDADCIPEAFGLLSVPEGVQVTQDDLAVVGENNPDDLRVIVEVGVNEDYNRYRSFTQVLLTRAADLGATYIGVDVGDRRYIHKDFPYARLVRCAPDQDPIFDVCRELAYANHLIDLLLIDGDHSVNMALRDWRLTSLLSPIGVVILHDTTVHPGPHVLFDAIDEKYYKKQKFFQDRTDDYGIAVAWRKSAPI